MFVATCLNHKSKSSPIHCERPANDLTIICPDDTSLGTFDCTNINEIPYQINAIDPIEDLMNPPYNIQFDGDLTPDIAVTTFDDAIVFYCEDNPRTINRNIIFYKDVNLNFVYDIGEEIGGCNFTIETVADVTPPMVTIPEDIVVDCGTEPEYYLTGEANFEDIGCPELSPPKPISQFSDEVIVNGSITTILRTWVATDPCGNRSEPQIQTITINCETDNNVPKTGTFNCGN